MGCALLLNHWAFPEPSAAITSSLIFCIVAITLCDIAYFLYKNRTPQTSAPQLDMALSNVNRKSLRITLGLFIATVVIFTLADLYFHGVIILGDRTRYSIFNSYEQKIRNISSLVWMLAPLAFLPLASLKTRLSIFAWAFIFPILVLDRNRLLMALFGTLIMVCLKYLYKLPAKTKYTLMASAIIGGIVIFAGFGFIRSGTTGIVSTYSDPRSLQIRLMGHVDRPYECEIPQYLPLNEEVKKISPTLQWIVLYAASPIYNLSIQDVCDIRDDSNLKAQIIPLWKKDKTILTPLLVSPRLNVGTEAMPFYLALGISGVILCLLLEYGILKFSAQWFLSAPNVFRFLIFLRVSYCAFFFGFAPQFYLWTTVGTILVVLFTQNFERVVKKFVTR